MEKDSKEDSSLIFTLKLLRTLSLSASPAFLSIAFGSLVVLAGYYVSGRARSDNTGASSEQPFWLIGSMIAAGVSVMFGVLIGYLEKSRFSVGRQKEPEINDVSFRLIKRRLDRINRDPSILVEAEKQKLVSNLYAKIKAETAIAIVDEIKQGIKLHSLQKLIDSSFTATRERLGNEVDALGTRANLNLVIGIIISVIGAILLGVAVYTSDHTSKDPALIAAFYLPRISLVLFIEVFAYFFLKLYKSNLSEIKYFQNELTNIESKFAALSVTGSLERCDSAVYVEVIRSLASTERNFVLKKGETTTEIEKARLDSQRFMDVAKILGDIAKRK